MIGSGRMEYTCLMISIPKYVTIVSIKLTLS